MSAAAAAAQAARQVFEALRAVDASAAHATASAVMPLLELRLASRLAANRLAPARAIELALRSVALAEETLPPDSLSTVHLRWDALLRLSQQRVTGEDMSAPDGVERMQALMKAAWLEDARLVALSRRNLAILHGRWRAGTLGTPRPDELAYCTCMAGADARRAGARVFVVCAKDALVCWPPAALDEAALRQVDGAVCAMLEADARGELRDVRLPGTLVGSRPPHLEEASRAVWELCHVLDRAALPRLLALGGFACEQLGALRALHERLQREETLGSEVYEKARELTSTLGVVATANAAAALAQHGLRRCALPACGAQEPAPRTYKKCGRCGAVHYCCGDHQAADWKRHKREDGCRAPDAAQM
jgi:hypothetical protein